MKPIRTLVAVCDDRMARIYENVGVGKGLNELLAMSSTDELHHGSDYTDRPGRSQAAPGQAGHAFDRENDEETQARGSFAEEVAKRLAEAAEPGADRIGLVAAPQMLGALRKALPHALTAKVEWEVDKDLVKLDPRDLADHLSGVAAF